MTDIAIKNLLNEIRACQICEPHLPLAPNPIIIGDSNAKLLIIGQAPGIKVHNTGIPWNDPSGNRLRQWLGLTSEQFYDQSDVAIMPMGFCYPGKGKSGDLPPRKECAPKWHNSLLALMPNIKLTLLIGSYAQRYYLPQQQSDNLTETVRRFREFAPDIVPLPHPSPRNNIWLRRNPWFDTEVVPYLQQSVAKILFQDI